MIINIIHDNSFDAKLAAKLHMTEEYYFSYQFSPGLDIKGDKAIIIGYIPQDYVEKISKNHLETDEWIKNHNKISKFTNPIKVDITYTDYIMRDIFKEKHAPGADFVNKYYDKYKYDFYSSLFKHHIEFLLDYATSNLYYNVLYHNMKQTSEKSLDYYESFIESIKRSAKADYFYCLSMGRRAIVINTEFIEYYSVHDIMKDHPEIDLFILYTREGLEKYRVKFFHKDKLKGEKMAKIFRNPSHFVYEMNEAIVNDISKIIK